MSRSVHSAVCKLACACCLFFLCCLTFLFLRLNVLALSMMMEERGGHRLGGGRAVSQARMWVGVRDSNRRATVCELEQRKAQCSSRSGGYASQLHQSFSDASAAALLPVSSGSPNVRLESARGPTERRAAFEFEATRAEWKTSCSNMWESCRDEDKARRAHSA